MNWYTRIEPDSLPPIEPGRRQKAARLLRDFVAGKITNDELEDGWPLGPGDPALNGVFDLVWFHYDDLSTHGFRGEAGSAADLLRCAAFLESELAYVWQRPHWVVRFAASLLGVVTLGLANRAWEPPPSYWPFPTSQAADGAASS